MNESLDSISSFFNKLLNIKTKDQSSNSRDQMNTLNSTNQSTNKSSSNRSSKDQKTTSKLTIDSLKAGLSDILDETNDYLNSIKSINASSSSNDLVKNVKSIEHNKEVINSNDQNKIVQSFDQQTKQISLIGNEFNQKIDSLNKSNEGEQTNLQSNNENLISKNENIQSIDSKLNERSIIKDTQIVNKDEKLNLNNHLNKVALNSESTNQLNSESIQQNDDYLLEKNVCFPLNNTTNKIFEEINLEDIRDDVRNVNIQNLKDIKDEKHTKINENQDKLITRDHLIEVAKEAEEKQEIDKENDLVPKSAKIFFQKSSKNDSEGKSKIKTSLFSVIKSDKNKSTDKNVPKSKSQSKNSLNDESNVLTNDNEFINKISINEQNLNKVKKSSSFSSTNSLATSSTSSDNVTSTNKENDCELLTEFNNAFKNNFLINQNLISDYQNIKLTQDIKLEQNNKPTKLNSQQLFENQTNSPPKPPSRTKSTSKLNKTQHDLDINSTKLNSHDASVNYSKIEITNQALSLNHSTQPKTNLLNSDENKLITNNYNENLLNNLDNNFQTNKTSNKVTISVNSNDKQINLEQTKLVNYKNNYQIKNDMNNEQQTNLIKQNRNEDEFNRAINSQQKQLQSTNGQWSSNDNLQTINDKSKRLIKLNNNLKLFNDKLQYESSFEPQLIKKSNTATNLKTVTNRSVKDKFDKCSQVKTKFDNNQRSVTDSIDKLVNKSISRLANKTLIKTKQNNEIINDKFYLSNYEQSLDNLLKVEKLKKSRIPLSKSSNALSYKPVTDYNHHSIKTNNNSLNLKQNLLNDNCLDVSSSSTCSLCTSLSTDSLESLTKKDSSRSSSLSNLNSSLDNCEFNKLKTSNSTSKLQLGSRPNCVRFIESNRNLSNTINSKANYPFRLDGVRSLSNLTNYHLIGYTNRRLLKTNSNNLFYPIRELSRIEESIDDDQEQMKQKNLDFKNDKLIVDNQIDNQSLITNNCSNNSNNLNTNLNSNFNSTIDTNSLISSSLDCMDESSDLTINKSSNLSNTSNTTNKLSTKLNDSFDNSLNNSLNHNKIKPSLNQFKSSVINQLIDSNTHLKNNICLINNTSINKLDHDDVNKSINLANLDLNSKQSKNDDNKLINDEIDLNDSNELNLIDNLNELQQNIFNSKKTLFTKNKLLLSKDSCRSFELNERIVDLEMQLTSHKTKFKESLNLIQLLSEHCNDLIDVFNDNYNCKLSELNELINENQRLIKLNQQFKLENLNLNETCDDLRRHLNQEQHSNQFDNRLNQDNIYKEQYKQLEDKYNKLKNALDYSRDNEQQLHDELTNLKIKFQQNNELYEKVKLKALEKVESANKYIEDANKNNDRELIIAKMQVKKTELKVEKLENELRNLEKENLELNQLLDSLK